MSNTAANKVVLYNFDKRGGKILYDSLLKMYHEKGNNIAIFQPRVGNCNTGEWFTGLEYVDDKIYIYTDSDWVGNPESWIEWLFNMHVKNAKIAYETFEPMLGTFYRYDPDNIFNEYDTYVFVPKEYEGEVPDCLVRGCGAMIHKDTVPNLLSYLHSWDIVPAKSYDIAY